MEITLLLLLRLHDANVTSAKLSYPLTTFSSTGIDDNATSTAITITSSERVGINETSPAVSFDVGTTGGGQIRYGFGGVIIDGGTVASGNMDDYKTSGFYRFNSAVTNTPSTHIFSTVIFGNGSNVVTQLAQRLATTLTYVRSFNNSWTSWQRLDT